MSQSGTNHKTPSTDSNKHEQDLKINPGQISGINSLRTQANLPAAQDIDAASNRIVAIEWLYRLSGRTNNVYSGLWQQYQAKLKQAKEAV